MTDPIVCPACREDRLVEFDEALQVFTCIVCSRQWRPRLPPTWTASVEAEVRRLGRCVTSKVFR